MAILREIYEVVIDEWLRRFCNMVLKVAE